MFQVESFENDKPMFSARMKWKKHLESIKSSFIVQ